MSDYVTDEMVETAARAIHLHPIGNGSTWTAFEYLPEAGRGFALRGTRAALDAVAPLIAAAALRDAADEADEVYAQEDVPLGAYGDGYMDGVGMALDFIRARADEVEADRG